MLADLRYADVGRRCERVDESLACQALAMRERQRAGCHVPDGRQALQQRLCRRDQHTPVECRQAREHRQTLRNDVLMWRKAVPGQRFPLGKVQHIVGSAGEEANLRFESFSLPRILGDYTDGPVEGRAGFADRERRAGTGQATPGPGVAGSRRGGQTRKEYGQPADLQFGHGEGRVTGGRGL